MAFFCIKHIIQGLFSFPISSFCWVYMWLKLPSTCQTPRLPLNCRKLGPVLELKLDLLILFKDIWTLIGRIEMGKEWTDWEHFWLFDVCLFVFLSNSWSGTSKESQTGEMQGFKELCCRLASERHRHSLTSQEELFWSLLSPSQGSKVMQLFSLACPEQHSETDEFWALLYTFM